MYNHCRNQKVWINYKEKEEEHDKIVLLGNDTLDTIEVLISKALIGSYIIHDELI